MSTHVPGEQYLYLICPDGEISSKPCKIGISVNPPGRVIRIRSLRSWPELDLIRIYECEKDALFLETWYKRELRDYTLDGTREWFEVKAGEIAGLIDQNDNCSPVEIDRF